MKQSLVAAVAVCALVIAGSATATATARRAACGRGQRSLGAQVCAVRGDRAGEIVATVRRLRRRDKLNAAIFGVWRGRRQLVSGALGSALPGVPATRGMYFRIGNTTESFETTLLMQMVDAGKLRLGDRLSEWFPRLPFADRITVGMLASSTSGYADYVRNDSFLDAFHANVFATWKPARLIGYGVSQPMLFAPGTSWSFSDTNFVLLGEILRRVGGMPVSEQIRRRILAPLGLTHTRMTPSAAVPAPTLHGYTDERGRWEDATFWSPSWATYTGDMTSKLSDLGAWGRAVGTGSLLSRRSHARQIAPRTVGFGRFTDRFFYGLGLAVANRWVIAGAPGLLGYKGIVAYLPSTRTTVVVFTTTGPHSPPGLHYAAQIFNAVGRIVAPRSAPGFPAGAAKL